MKRAPILLMALPVVLACSDTATEPALDLQPDLGLEPPSFAPANRLEKTQQTVPLFPVYGDVANMRWSDIAGHLYDPAVQDPALGYDYAQANVTVTFNEHGTSFQGHLSASGLKPNFAYQLKLNGKPEIDPWANDQLGTFGRWWPEPGYPNSGYLVFDYVVTDSDGDVEHDMDLASSYHVLWRVDQRSPDSFGTESSHPTRHKVWARASSDWYDADHPREARRIFGESEHVEYPPGTVVLPAGQYDVSFFLTEESFHEDGYWATVMANDGIGFTIGEPPPEPVDPLTEVDRNGNGWVCMTEKSKGNRDPVTQYADDKNPLPDEPGTCRMGWWPIQF